MKTVVKEQNPQSEADGEHWKLYEAMFLVDPAQVADWEGKPISQEKGETNSQPAGGQAVRTTIETILERADARIVSMKKWDERKLAYEINHNARGTYILVYFRADGEKIRDIERDVQLSEQIMRVLILSVVCKLPELVTEDSTEEQQAVKDTEKQPAEKASEPVN